MIIFINGSINSGKTSVAKALIGKLANTAHIEIDSLREFIENESLEKAIPINIENTILVGKNLLKHKYNLIISYPLPLHRTKELVDAFKEMDKEIYYFSLSPKLEKALENRGARELTEAEIERIKYHYEKGINDPGFGVAIDNSNQSINDTVEEILKNINGKNILDLKVFENE